LQGRYKLLVEIERIHNKGLSKESEKFYIFGITDYPEITLGRDVTNDIELDELSVSRFHSKIIFNREEQSFQLLDLKSTYGTVIKLSEERLELRGKQMVIFGRKLI
jgi:hypothetical protein